MARKNSKTISEELKEEPVTKPEAEAALEERVKCLETIVKNLPNASPNLRRTHRSD